jgi:hypothetical protein
VLDVKERLERGGWLSSPGPVRAVDAFQPPFPASKNDRMHAWLEAQQARVDALRAPRTPTLEPDPGGPAAPSTDPKAALNRRLGDWSPVSPEVQSARARIERWDAAQRTVDDAVARARQRDAAPAPEATPSRPTRDPGPPLSLETPSDRSSRHPSDKRRYDWATHIEPPRGRQGLSVRDCDWAPAANANTTDLSKTMRSSSRPDRDR